MNIKLTNHIIAAALAVATGLTSPVLAQDKGPETSLALGVASIPDYEGSDSYELIPFAIARTQWKSGRYISLEGLTLRSNLLASDTWHFGPLLSLELERDDVDDTWVSSMPSVDTAYEAGLFAEFETGRWGVAAQFKTDISGVHDGWVASLDVSYALILNRKLQVFAEAFVNYADSEYMDTYFSVDVDSVARSGFNFYSASAGVKDYGLELFGNFRLSDRWSLMPLLQYSRLVGDAADSPLVRSVGSENQWFYGLALNHQF